MKNILKIKSYGNYGIIKTAEVLDHSFELIDLIEVGDIVNGHKVIYVCLDEINDKYIKLCNDRNKKIRDENIRMVLTHEQVNENCLKKEDRL